MRQQLKARVFLTFVAVAMSAALAGELRAQAPIVDVGKALAGFDGCMAKVLKGRNGPGIGAGIVVGDTLVFAKGYGYRDYEKQLPFARGTVCPIA